MRTAQIAEGTGENILHERVISRRNVAQTMAGPEKELPGHVVRFDIPEFRVPPTERSEDAPAEE